MLNVPHVMNFDVRFHHRWDWDNLVIILASYEAIGTYGESITVMLTGIFSTSLRTTAD